MGSEATPPLPGAIAAMLDDARVPLTTYVLRALLSATRNDAITAERLSRVAGYEREAFLRARGTPRFCAALAPDGTALRPRVWARGDWRLARRIQTDDVRAAWHERAALVLVNRMAASSGRSRKALA